MIASLGMYDRAETAAANDQLWANIRDGLRAEGIAAPDALTRGDHAYWDAWQSPDLVFSQTCGFPFRAKLHDQVTLIGTPDYDLPGCPPGHYTSVFVARHDDPRTSLAEFSGAPFAYNEDLSQSGWAAPQNHAHAHGLHFPPSLQTGGHRLSALAVANGRADLAAIDALTWEFLSQYEPFAANLREIARTEPTTPVLPYITAKGADAALYFRVTKAAIAALSPADRATLHLKGLIAIPVADYLAVPTPPSPEQIAHNL
ncbi:phosphate/phosphite/phosphonate ABC transporter substrate-binding protein [Cypionkella sp.]|uniref:phosphate/phosphite/phosphonate ABC transporter substrate-binding protein n=1 Tax=Cypionkella sp. TaxID=2811411 RepID=UPI002AB8FF40|nr:PhnD/SsuA/transferrin family substrate-binding protein [Cypionkella sp.]MDZ4393248.1 PhnD/SsuA/transferrin family substrate-binding protein [Cypionkella sp.]